MKLNKNNILLVALFVVFAAGGIYFYKVYDPSSSGVHFPKCGFYVLTGYKCPGCGTQRALHHLLNGDIVESFRQNALVYLAIPYIIMVIIAKKSAVFREKFPRLSLFLNGYRSTLVVVIAIFVFWIARNIWNF